MSSSEGVNFCSKLLKFTAADFTCVQDLFPVGIKPNAVGASTAVIEVRMGGLSLTIL